MRKGASSAPPAQPTIPQPQQQAAAPPEQPAAAPAAAPPPPPPTSPANDLNQKMTEMMSQQRPSGGAGVPGVDFSNVLNMDLSEVKTNQYKILPPELTYEAEIVAADLIRNVEQ